MQVNKDTSVPSLSVVIVNSDGLGDTMNCLESIFDSLPTNSFEVICVDNLSTETALPMIQQKFPQVRLFSAPQRQGFSRNYNLGIRQTIGEFVLILNNDTLVHSGTLDSLLEMIRTDSTYGMVGPRLIGLDGCIQSVCARPLVTPVSFILSQLLFDKGMPIGRLLERYRGWRLSMRPSGPVPCISGSCMLISRRALDQVGMLDEDYEFYFEDVDWCHRMNKNGFKVGFVSEALVTHLCDQSLSKNREWAKKSEYLSALRYFRQYHRLTNLQAKLLWGTTIINFSFRWLAFWLMRIITGKSGQLSAYHHLVRWIIENPPDRKDYNLAT